MKALTYTVESSQGLFLVTVKPVGMGYFLVSARKPEVSAETRSTAVPAVLTASIQSTVNEIVPD